MFNVSQIDFSENRCSRTYYFQTYCLSQNILHKTHTKTILPWTPFLRIKNHSATTLKNHFTQSVHKCVLKIIYVFRYVVYILYIFRCAREISLTYFAACDLEEVKAFRKVFRKAFRKAVRKAFGGGTHATCARIVAMEPSLHLTVRCDIGEAVYFFATF